MYRLAATTRAVFRNKRYDKETAISLLDFQFEPGERTIETQKPVSLLNYLIQTYSKSGDTVLDPTGGVFSTGVACRNNNRRFIGIEEYAYHFYAGVGRLRQLSPMTVEEVSRTFDGDALPILNRARACPSPWTFSIVPVRELLARYVPAGANGWLDPMAGMFSPAEFTNDMHPNRNARWHMEAILWADVLPHREFEGMLFDPPYSYRQVSEHYRELGQKATQIDTSSAFYSRVKDKFADKIRIGGFAICCGWNSVGFGSERGFQLVEVLIVCHGGHHNDTIITVERKIKDPKA
jgi:hypothetical protein